MTTGNFIAIEGELDQVTGGALIGDREVEMLDRWVDRGEKIGEWCGRKVAGERGVATGRAVGGGAAFIATGTKVATGWVNDTLGWPGNQLVDLATRRR
jgi:hypothetical protein